MQKIFALNINGNPVNLPPAIDKLTKNAGDLGSNIIGLFITTLFLGAIFVCLFFLIFGGIKWISSEGDPKKFEGARDTIIWAAAGLAIVFLSFLIINVISSFLGTSLFVGSGGK